MREVQRIQQVDKIKPLDGEKGEFTQMRMGVKSQSIYERYSTFNGVANGLYHEPEATKLEGVVDDLETKDKKSFETLLRLVKRKYKITDKATFDRIKSDKDIKATYLSILREKMSDRQDWGRIIELQQELSMKIIAYLPKDYNNKREEFSQYTKRYFFFKNIEFYRDKILSTNNKHAVKIWRDGIKQIRKDIQSGKIKTSKQFTNRLFEIFDAAIDASNNKELQTAWGRYKKINEVNSVSLAYDDTSDENDPKEAKDKPIKNKKDGKVAMKKVTTKVAGVPGYEIENTSTGHATVVVNGEFAVSMSLFKNEEDGKFYYYLNDEFRNGSPIRVEAKNLLSALYERQIDGIMTKKLMDHPEFASEIGDVPDKDVIKLITKILGMGKDKNFEITAEDLEMIKVLVKILKGKDYKYSSLQGRIDALNDTLSSASRCQHAKRLLLDHPNDFGSVSMFEEALKRV